MNKLTVEKPDWWDEWTEFDEERFERVIRDDAPQEVLLEWHAMQDEMQATLDDE